MRPAARRVRLACRALWAFVREWSGDAAYDIYRARGLGAEPLSREAFWLESLKRRYDRISRCC